jgi:hypothetical protein
MLSLTRDLPFQQFPMMTTCCHSSAGVAHAVENVSVLALFYGRSSPEHSAEAFLAFLGNFPMPTLLMLLPIQRLMLPRRLRLPLPVTVLNLVAI